MPIVKQLDNRDFLVVPNCISISMNEQMIVASGAALKIQTFSKDKIFISFENGKGRGVFLEEIDRDSTLMRLQCFLRYRITVS